MTAPAAQARTRRGRSRTALRVVHVLTESGGGGGVHVHDLVGAGLEAGQDAVVADASELGLRALALEVRAADVVHCHGVRAALTLPPAGRAPIVLTTHGLHGLRSAPAGPRGTAVRAMSRAAMSRARVIVCVSADDAATLAATSPRLVRRSRTIVNGVQPLALPAESARRTTRAELNVPPGAPLLVFAGSLIDQKHPELALDAAMRARAAVPDLRLLVAGDGPLMPALVARGAPGIRFLGRRTDVHAIVGAADAVLNTSRWEGLSLALLEALWLGRPIVATDAPGNAEAVGPAGFVVPQDAERLADAIVRMVTEPGLAETLGLCARERAESCFNVREMAARTLAVHTEVARWS